jgi:drug/metabolite transporter (DMT)-like permease
MVDRPLPTAGEAPMTRPMLWQLLGVCVVALGLGAVGAVMNTDTLAGAVVALAGLLVALLGALAVGRRHRR